MPPEQGASLSEHEPPALTQKQRLTEERLQFSQGARQSRLGDALSPRDGREIPLARNIQKGPDVPKLHRWMYALRVIHMRAFCIIHQFSVVADYGNGEEIMQVLTRPWGAMHYRVDGAVTGPTVVFANSLGTDLHLWDALLPHLPKDFRFIRYDKPGHGLSDIAETSISELANDAAALIEAVGGPVVFVGLSIGGLVGQALASTRPELLRGLVLSNTAARIGTAESWLSRVDAVKSGGMESIADAVMERWFAAAYRTRPELALWRNMLVRTPAEGYIAACKAIAAADLTDATRQIKVPVMVIAGSEDGATPPDLVAGTAALVEGAVLHRMEGVAHIPCVEDTGAYAALLTPFLKEHASYGYS